MSKDLCIDRCVCYDRTFAELRIASVTEDLGMDELSKRFGCGTCCGMCRPYIERMLETGETVFHQIVVAREGEDAAARR
jgi:bacterioferritin-associated ferredoxin